MGSVGLTLNVDLVAAFVVLLSMLGLAAVTLTACVGVWGRRVWGGKERTGEERWGQVIETRGDGGGGNGREEGIQPPVQHPRKRTGVSIADGSLSPSTRVSSMTSPRKS